MAGLRAVVATGPTAPQGSPNVLLIVLDDVGFAQLGCYGSDIDTPVIDGLAGSGIRLAIFRTTALCSPTRACLLTRRNHHRNGMGRVADLAMGFPGYWGKPPKENGSVSEILRSCGYATYVVGKWHLTPEDEMHMGAPRGTWPLGRGFDRWYGFHGGETHQFVPALYHDNHSVRPPRPFEDGYHLSADLADRAIEFVGDLRAVEPSAPFSSTSVRVHATHRTMHRRSTSSATETDSPPAGTSGGPKHTPASLPLASSRPTPDSLPVPGGSRRGPTWTTSGRRWPPASWSVSPHT